MLNSFYVVLVVVLSAWLVFSFKFETVHGREGPYLTRFVLGSLRIHCFHRPDEDAETHSHPWDFWTFPLVGYYEEVLQWNTAEHSFWYKGENIAPGQAFVGREYVRPFRWHKRSASHSHRILHSALDVNGGDIMMYSPGFRASRSKRIWTIVWTGARVPTWAFSKVVSGRVESTESSLFIKQKGLRPLVGRSLR